MKPLRITKILLAAVLWCAAASAAPIPPAVAVLSSTGAFDAAIAAAGDRLVMVQFTADWCAPCRQVAPIIAAIAAGNPDILAFSVDVDRNGALAAREGIRGIPCVAFYRQGKKVYDLVGLHAEYRYHQAIRQFDASRTEAADGNLADGVRVIRRSAAAALESIHVYRGETVMLSMTPADTPYSIHIPGLSVSLSAAAGAPLSVRFKADKVGVYPIFCNGACPSGDGSQSGRIVVMPYGETAGDGYTEVSAAEAHRWIAEKNPFILDVRTPREFGGGHIPGAVLIPLQQLTDRIGEIATHKDRAVFIYCRSGNRSTVAAEILRRAGFRTVWNLRHGILEWQAAGYPVKTPG